MKPCNVPECEYVSKWENQTKALFTLVTIGNQMI